MTSKKLPPEYPDSLPPVVMRERMLERLNAKEDQAFALATVHARLVQASLRMEQVGDNGRYGVSLGVEAVLEYFSAVGIPIAALAPLHEVQAAIVDARRGIENPVFRPDRVGGGAPPTPFRTLEFEGYLAVVTECCVRHLKSQKVRAYMMDGCTLASKLISESSWGVKPTAKELREIRERIYALTIDRPDNVTFRSLLDSPFSEERPLEWAKLILKHEWVSRPAANFLSKPSF